MRWLLVTFLATGCPGPGANSGPPAPDTCNDLQPRDPVDSVELGAGTGDDLFLAWNDGDTAPLVHGPQGGAMIGIRLRVTGTPAPECLPQSSVVRDAASMALAAQDEPVKAYDQGDGSRVTRTMWLIFDQEPEVGDSVTVESTVLGVVASRSVVLGAN
jgi:hypothetical protein